MGGRSLDRADLTYISALLAASLAFYIAFLFRKPLVYGYDGAYYLVQLRHISRTGMIKYGDPPLAFYILYAFYLITGDPTSDIKLGTALVASTLVLPTYALIKYWFGERRAALLGTFAVSFGYQVLRLSCDLLKNLVGSVFFMASAYFFTVGLSEHKKPYLLVSSLFLVLAGLTHILAFLTASAFSFIYAFVVAMFGPSIRQAKEALKSLALALSVPLSMAAVGFVLLPEFFQDVVKIGYFLTDILLLQGLGLPVEPWPMIYILFGLSCFTAYKAFRKTVGKGPGDRSFFVLACSLLGLVITAPSMPADWLWRTSLMGFLPFSTIMLELTDKGRRARLLAILMAIMLAHTAAGFVVMGPSVGQAELEDLKAMKPLVPPGSLVYVPDQAVVYWAEYVLDRDCRWYLEYSFFVKYEHVFVILRHGSKMPYWGLEGALVLVYEGRTLVLYEIHLT